jgi:microcompartment protein CcmK/EutM
MKVGRVVGQVVGSEKHPQLEGCSLLVVRPESLGGLDGGSDLIAVDRIGVSVGERILLVDDGAAARLLFGSAGPIRAVIVGVVDEAWTQPSEGPA